MLYGVREICDVVLKKTAPGWFGKLYLDAGMPVIYFDTLKTSSLEGTSEVVYAQGGKGNPRLVAWEGDRTVTFTMEDALISPESFSILSGAGFMDAAAEKPIFVHATQQVAVTKVAGEEGQTSKKIILNNDPAVESDSSYADMFIMMMKADGSIDASMPPMKVPNANIAKEMDPLEVINAAINAYNASHAEVPNFVEVPTLLESAIKDDSVFLVDYYVKAETGVKQIDIEAGKFGGSYYLEASTLFRSQSTGEDHAAEFVIPNCKVQSNFTFTMASTGDPSTFTFTMDAFPGYTKFDKTKKVIAALQIVEDKNVVITD